MANYTEEQKINAVFLLHYRYNGRVAPCSEVLGINRATLKGWIDDYLPVILRERGGDPYSGDSRVVPTLIDLKERTLIRMRETVGREIDYAKLARAAQTLEMMLQGAPPEKEENLFEQMNRELQEEEQTKNIL